MKTDSIEVIRRFNNGNSGASVVIHYTEIVPAGFGSVEDEEPRQTAILLSPERCREIALELLTNHVRPGALSVIRDLIKENKL